MTLRASTVFARFPDEKGLLAPLAEGDGVVGFIHGNVHFGGGRFDSLVDAKEAVDRDLGHNVHAVADAGLIVLVSFISPFRAERRMARALFQPLADGLKNILKEEVIPGGASKVFFVIAPAIKTEGKLFQSAQKLGMCK